MSTDSWLAFAAVGVPSFAAGFMVGRLSETRKELVMGYKEAARSWFERNVAVLYMIVAVLALVGIVTSTAATLTNARQDTQRAADNAARDASTRSLIQCVNGVLSDLTGGLPPIRVASVARDEATGNRDDALQALIGILVSSSNDEVPTPAEEEARRRAFGIALTDLAAAGKALDRAQANLERVRAENPYPQPSNELCGVSKTAKAD